MIEDTRSALIHRELIQLTLLIAIAIAAFAATRAVAANSRELTRRDAAEWYNRGTQALRDGRIDTAVDAFRRAASKDPVPREYSLALSRALTETGQFAAARDALARLRDAQPDDPAVNLELARLAARQDEVDEAVRFYHNALYAPWPAGAGAQQALVRLELARFLIGHRQSSRALSELLVSSAELADTASAQVELGELFAQAGDTRHALDHYQRALRLEPRNAAALAGAGQNAFARGDYATARALLPRAVREVPRVQPLLEIADLVLTADPLAPRLGTAERVRRLTADLSYTRERLGRCAGGAALLGEADTFAAQMTPVAMRESESIDAGVDLIDRLERAAVETCPPATPMDRALLIIGSRHGGDPR